MRKMESKGISDASSNEVQAVAVGSSVGHSRYECSWDHVQLQFTGGKSIVTAIRYYDAVRFAIQNEKVVTSCGPGSST